MRKPLDLLYSELKVTFRLLKRSLPKGLNYFLVFSLFLFISSISFSFLGFFGQRIDQVKATSLELENRILAGKLLDLEFFQSELDKEIKELSQMEQNIRSFLGLKTERIRELEDENQFLIENNGLYPEVKMTDLDRLIDEIKGEKEGFEHIYQKLIQKKDFLDHTPSVYPVNGYISRGFGIEPDPFSGEMGLHQGLDIVADIGTPVIAAAKGRVSFVGWRKGLGKLVTLDHGNGYQSSYGHLSVILVQDHQEVERGEVIGRVGNTGYSTGPHLHYEVHLKGRLVNPQPYLWGGRF
ncbi:MAG: peptidoglycan DD-metalloendopeptidase family protein [candidate division Zixibacteria bacterium]|nr:peptidoglycan DD-metalloendopeptidase family protein [candidate division Zixibacteria bacterium]